MAQIAAAQRSLVHRSQLRDLGISRGSYEHRVVVGSLHRVFPSVLSVVDGLVERWAAETAALLYAGDHAVLSHDSAAALWGLAGNPSFVAITLIGRKAESQPGLRVHRVAALDIRDVRLRHGLPVTSPARTLIDCAATHPAIDRLLNEARALDLASDQEIRETMDRCPRRKGVSALRALMQTEMDDGYTRSEAERILRRMIRESGIERPLLNTRVEGVEADAYWPRHKLVVEVDGYRFHGRWAKFQSDRERDNRLVAAGYTVLRFTWHQLTHRPMYVLAQIVRTIARIELSAG